MQIIVLKKRLAEYSRKIARNGFVIGASGNLSIKNGNNVYIKASSKAFGEAKASDFVRVNASSNYSQDLRPSSEYRLHLECYKMRSDIRTIFHTHPPLSTALYPASRDHVPLTLEFALYITRPVQIIDFLPPGSIALARATAAASKTSDAIIIKNHGLVVLGATMQEAYLKTLIIEQEAKARLIYKIFKKKPDYLTKSQIDALIGT
jgi:L-fuculose-phosphate aldolase